jgi:hypothetical protein
VHIERVFCCFIAHVRTFWQRKKILGFYTSKHTTLRTPTQDGDSAVLPAQNQRKCTHIIFTPANAANQAMVVVSDDVHEWQTGQPTKAAKPSQPKQIKLKASKRRSKATAQEQLASQEASSTTYEYL